MIAAEKYNLPIWTVYKYTDLHNSLVYIGITSRTLKQRWQNGWGYKSNPRLHNAIQKYGESNFVKEILYSGLTFEQAAQKEIETIALYDSTNPLKGYNISLGGDAPMWGRHHNPKLKQKWSEERKGANNSFYGRHHDLKNLSGCIPVICLNTLEHFVACSEAAKIMTQKGFHSCRTSGITAVLRGECLTAGKDNNGNPLFWERYDKSLNLDYYASLFEQKRTEYKTYMENMFYNESRGKVRKKYVINVFTGVIYKSAKEAAKILGYCYTDIIGSCNGSKNMTNNQIFLYLENYEKMSPEEIKEEIIKRWTRKFEEKTIYPIVCLNTGEIFPNTIAAQKITQMKHSDTIADCAHKECEYGGVSKAGEFLKWRYYDEYITLSPEEIKTIVNKPVKGHQPVLCVTNGLKFRDGEIAAKYYNTFRSGIRKCCLGQYQTCAEDENGNRLKWRYLDEYDYPNQINFIDKTEQEEVIENG